MMYATQIKMKQGCSSSNNVQEISEVYLEGCQAPGFYKKEGIHDYLLKNPNSIQVKISPFPFMLPAISVRGEKYVRSEPNDTTRDNLLSLPRA